jgi:hypothetical protein
MPIEKQFRAPLRMKKLKVYDGKIPKWKWKIISNLSQKCHKVRLDPESILLVKTQD